MDDYQFACFYADCPRRYNTKFNLQRHINTQHLNMRDFQCNYCPKRFPSKQNWTEHMYIHTNEKPYYCKFEGCGKHFRQSSQLAVHHKIHKRRGESPQQRIELPEICAERQLKCPHLPLPASLRADNPPQ